MNLKVIRRRAVGLPLISAAFLVLLITGVTANDRYTAHAEQSHDAVLTTRIDQLRSDQIDLKSTLSALQMIVQEQRDKQNQMQGMLIGFGGFAALLQVLNAILQYRSAKQSGD